MILWMAVIVTVLNEFSRAEECYLTELQGNVVHCEMKGIKTDGVSKTNVTRFQVGTKSLVVDGSTIAHIQCVDTIWKIIGVEDISELHLHGRQKRSIPYNRLLDYFKSLIDETPPNMICNPPIIYATASRYTTYAKVSWSEPIAHDEKDGQIQPKRFGRSPGEYFPEGTSEVTYVAKDRSGNNAICSIHVVVKVVRCYPLQNLPNANFLCHPDFDFIYGCECRFYCHEGFELHGPGNMRCGEKGQWSNAQPTCRYITCGRPSSIAHGSFTGTVFTFNHQVQYKCNSKFNMADQSGATRTCTEHGYWSGKVPECIYAAYCESSPCRNGATCLELLGDYQCQCQTGWTGHDCEVDIQPPVVTGCPKNRTIMTAERIFRQKWEVPNMTDPHGLEIKITGNYQNSSYDFPWGNFTVQYHAVKSSNGLTAECSFTISIRPYPCEKIRPPVNGIVVCNNWKTDRVNVCIFVCKSNYTLPLHFSKDDLYVCGATGSWLPPKLVTNCVTDEFFPWTNDNEGKTFSSCSTPGAIKEIGEYYIENLKKSAFNSLCVDNPINCKPENVLIQC